MKYINAPTFSSQPEVVSNQLWNWYLDCSFYVLKEKADLKYAELTVLQLIEESRNRLTPYNTEYKIMNQDLINDWLATFHDMLAEVQRSLNKKSEAIISYEKAISLSGRNLHIFENYIRFVLKDGDIESAISVINRIQPDLLDMEEDSTASYILNWVLMYPELGKSISENILRKCLYLLGKYGKWQIHKNRE